MKNLILEIRNRLNASQEDLARMIGISYATVNRWENVCKERNIDLEDIIQKKIEKSVVNVSSSSEKGKRSIITFKVIMAFA